VARNGQVSPIQALDDLVARRQPSGRRGRVERAVNAELGAEPDLLEGPERAMLRAQARAVDLAEQAGDPALVTTANRGLLEMRRALGLVSVVSSDREAAWTRLMELMSTPTRVEPRSPDWE
jgi:hypothetical protein